MGDKLNHFDDNGNAVMVDVSGKEPTVRVATARGTIRVNEKIMEALVSGNVKKGDVLGVARVAGIMGVKQTSGLIPMCHTLLIQKASVDFEIDREKGEVTAICTVKTISETGVAMEALTGVSTALLTIYDMCKALSKTMEIGEIHLEMKSGGKSGTYIREEEAK